MQEKIEEEAREFQDLLLRVQEKHLLTQSAEYQQGISKLPLSGLQSQLDKKEDDELLLSDRPDETSTQTITIKKEEIQFRKRPCEEQQGQQSYRELFEDENSQELDSRIDRLERQIVRDGGQILFEKPEQQPDPEEEDAPNFLT